MGPVLLLGLRVSVILEDMAAIRVGTGHFLEGHTPPELNVSVISSISSKSGMKSMSFDQGQDEHIILTEGGYSHTLRQ